MTDNQHTARIRGCTHTNQHTTTCDNQDSCTGCRPRLLCVSASIRRRALVGDDFGFPGSRSR